MVAGIILNSVVIISLLRSSQLRKKLCYFTILVLSCGDLAEVTIVQPLLILIINNFVVDGNVLDRNWSYADVRIYSLGKFLNVCTVNVKYWTIYGPNASIFPSNRRY